MAADLSESLSSHPSSSASSGALNAGQARLLFVYSSRRRLDPAAATSAVGVAIPLFLQACEELDVQCLLNTELGL